MKAQKACQDGQAALLNGVTSMKEHDKLCVCLWSKGGGAPQHNRTLRKGRSIAKWTVRQPHPMPHDAEE
eukprot:6185965-Pleurochrysis_carterae.AAC.2